jgi:hypothetical protein
MIIHNSYCDKLKTFGHPSNFMTTPQVNMPFFSERWVKATYVGGHKAFPKKSHTKVGIYSDRLELTNPSILIPYSSIKNIENMDDKKISKLRVVVLGLVFLPLAIVGALWKKKMLYTVIQYNDETDEQTIILDFGKKIEEIQPLVYQKMLSAARI